MVVSQTISDASSPSSAVASQRLSGLSNTGPSRGEFGLGQALLEALHSRRRAPTSPRSTTTGAGGPAKWSGRCLQGGRGRRHGPRERRRSTVQKDEGRERWRGPCRPLAPRSGGCQTDPAVCCLQKVHAVAGPNLHANGPRQILDGRARAGQHGGRVRTWRGRRGEEGRREGEKGRRNTHTRMRAHKHTHTHTHTHARPRTHQCILGHALALVAAVKLLQVSRGVVCGAGTIDCVSPEGALSDRAGRDMRFAARCPT